MMTPILLLCPVCGVIQTVGGNCGICSAPLYAPYLKDIDGKWIIINPEEDMPYKEKKIDEPLDTCPYCGHDSFVYAVGIKPNLPGQDEVDPTRTQWHAQCLACEKGWTEIFKIEKAVFLSEEEE